MILIQDQQNHDASFNLALEEYCLLNLPMDSSYLLFYVNAPSIIIGKHQNTVEEIDTDFVQERGIRVVRRISGGGAVYHDLGNLNFSFIRPYRPEHFNNYREFTAPVVAALQELGVPAELTGRNDIVVDGRKVSGNAQARRRDRMFSHGTLLFRSNLEDVVRSLKPKPGKLESKGIQSIRSRVVNIGDFLPGTTGMEEFKAALVAHLFPGQGGAAQYVLTAQDLAAVQALADSKYRTWEWNYGSSPSFNLQRVQRFPIGEVDARLLVEKGHVHSAKIYGDFFSDREIGDLEQALTGIRYEQEELRKVLSASRADEILDGVGVDDWVKLLY
ncbi:MAG: lipoate--protein ligase [Flavobacteriales bacterium]|nr:lipoate--protein ligase [Flavobacteriales bacterium]MCL4282999.1 lipoate--protein ligase [Flavobacteriales bacterium]